MQDKERERGMYGDPIKEMVHQELTLGFLSFQPPFIMPLVTRCDVRNCRRHVGMLA